MSEELLAGGTLALHRCPHCQIAKPLLISIKLLPRSGSDRVPGWHGYQCTNCSSMVLVQTQATNSTLVKSVFPDVRDAPLELPDSARRYLTQAYRTVQDAPDAAAIMASSAVDDMLKQKGYTDQRSLHDRIDAARNDHLLTDEMAKWAHRIRFVSNNPRHADDANPHVEPDEAKRMLAFAEALAQYLYVLPALAEQDTEDA